MEYLSKRRYDDIAAELNHLVSEVYPEVRDHVAETTHKEIGVRCGIS